MNPSSNELRLPPPVEQLPPVAGVAEAGIAQPEQAPAGPESARGSGQVAPVAASPLTMPLPMAAPTATLQSDVSATSQSVALNTTDDTDLIEKEWVNKAKRIVERTRDDPYQQSEQLTVVKADYMQKRYGKAIKVSK